MNGSITKCPQCQSENVVFCGLARDTYGKDWENKWFCRYCQKEFIVELTREQREKFNE